MSLLRTVAQHAQRGQPVSSTAGLSSSASCAATGEGPSAPGPHPGMAAAAAPGPSGATSAASGAAAVEGTHNSGGSGGGGGGPPPASSRAVAAAGWSGVPPVAKTLGLAGLIPFIALSPPVASVLPFLPADLVANAALLQVAYGASICSFLGGVHWGAAFGSASGAVASETVPAGAAASLGQANFERYVWGVIPCLMAWPAVTMASGPGAFVIASTLAVAHAADRSFAKRQLLPPWYMWLRLPLTTLAMGGMALTVYDSIASEFSRTQQSVPLESEL